MQAAFQHVANAAHLSNRVVAFTQVEVENNEDEEDKKALLESKEQVTVGKELYRDCCNEMAGCILGEIAHYPNVPNYLSTKSGYSIRVFCL